MLVKLFIKCGKNLKKSEKYEMGETGLTGRFFSNLSQCHVFSSEQVVFLRTIISKQVFACSIISNQYIFFDKSLDIRCQN